MADSRQSYSDDPRTPCKYGVKCYQRNPVHHQNFKHPPKDTKRKIDTQDPTRKKYKPTTSPQHHVEEGDRKIDDDITKDENHDQGSSPAPKGASTSKTNRDEANKDVLAEEIVITLPETISCHDKTNHSLLKELFLVEMPQDFFDFLKCLEEMDSYEKVLSGVNLQLIGPYELLLGRLPVLDDKDLYLIHWRFFFDPPEFQAILKRKGKSEFHMGYFRDEPGNPPEFVASCDSSKNCVITPVADNIFAAIYLYLEQEKKSSPFVSVACQKLIEKVKKWGQNLGYSLNEFNIRKRLAKIPTKTFHGAGIVVPIDKKIQLGYRKLVETDASLRKMFASLQSAEDQEAKDKVLSELQDMITYANIAVDEGDFGTGMEAGIDLFCSGIAELHASALNSLVSAYSLLGRHAFAKIIQVHLKYRRKGPNMSVLMANDK